MSRIKLWVEQPQSLLIIFFLSLIICGTIVLLFPISHNGKYLSFVDAFFTATSASCVTGLIVVDTGKDFTPFGQVVILMLIQIGGLGIMTFTAFSAWVISKRLSFRNYLYFKNTFGGESELTVLRKKFIFIFLTTFLIEFVGMCLLFLGFINNGLNLSEAIYSAFFHSISAFCNAGFSVYSNSLSSFANDYLINLTIVALIFLGGIGYPVLWEIYTRWKLKKNLHYTTPRWSIHLKSSLFMSISLIIIGGMFVYFIEFNRYNYDGNKILLSLFQSATTRTAGFNTIDITRLSLPVLFLFMILMFIGGSSGSCAGGIKTTTFLTLLAMFRAWLNGEEDVHLFKRRLPLEVIKRVSSVFILGLILVVISVFLLLITETISGCLNTFSLKDVLFEVFSAFGTVGLSTGITPHLSTTGKWVIIITMFIGRVGPLTIATSILLRRSKKHIASYADEGIMIG